MPQSERMPGSSRGPWSLVVASMLGSCPSPDPGTDDTAPTWSIGPSGGHSADGHGGSTFFASVPNPKSASLCRGLVSGLRIRRTLGNV